MTERRRPLWIAACLVLLAAGGELAAATFGDLEIAPFNEPQGYTAHGYTEYRINVRHTNKDGKEHKVKLSLPDSNDAHGIGGRIVGVSRTVEVKPGQTMTVSLLVPAEPSAYGNGVRVWIDDREMDNRVPMNIVTGMFSSRFGGGGLTTMILYSQRVPEKFFDTVDRGRGMGGMGGVRMPGGVGVPIAPGPPVKVIGGPPEEAGKEEEIGGKVAERPYTLESNMIRADVPVSAWSRHWLAFSRYDGILVTTDDLAELARAGNEAQAILLALHQWTEAGGVLYVLGPGKAELPASWSRRTAQERGYVAYSPGFGRCFVTSDRDSAKWNRERWSIFDEVNTTARAFTSRTMQEANRTLPAVDDLGVPVRGLFAMMFLFAIAIGPGNVWLLYRWNRRIWLWWTVPVFSALTCAMVFGYMVVSEGWQGHSRVVGFTVLDESEKRATTLGRTSFYSPLSPSDGLRFETDTEVSVMGTNSAMGFGRHHREQQSTLGSCEVHWGGDQHFRRGWVPARVPAHFQLRKSKADLKRVIVTREGDSLVLVNALGVSIRRIVLADEKGQVYQAQEIAEGAKATLQPTGAKVAAQPDSVRGKVFSTGDWAATILGGSPSRFDGLLTPRSYVAVVEGSPFLEQALKGARVRETESIVLGLMAE